MGEFKWVVLANEVGWSGFYVNIDWSGLGGLKWIFMQNSMIIYKCRSVRAGS